MILLSWNACGLGAKPKRMVLKKMISKFDPWFVFLQAYRSLWNCSSVDHCLSPFVGSSGGLISLWQTHLFKIDSCTIKRNWIAVEGLLCSFNFKCIIVNVYNPCSVSLRAGV